MKTHVLQLSPLMTDTLLAMGIIAVFGMLGFASHEFALQANLFFEGFGV